MNAHVLHALQYRLYTSSVPNGCTISASSTCVNALRWQNNEAGTRNQRCTWIHNAWFKGSICCMNHPWNQPWKATLKAFHQHSQDSEPCKNPWTRHAFTSASQANGQQPTANNCPFPSKTCKLTCNVMSKNKAPMHALLLTLLVGMAPHFYCLNIWPPWLHDSSCRAKLEAITQQGHAFCKQSAKPVTPDSYIHPHILTLSRLAPPLHHDITMWAFLHECIGKHYSSYE